MPSASLHGDEDLIRRLLVNLLDNAVRHAPRGSTVRIELAPTSAGYAIAISDEGPGIAPEQQARIFERFYRAQVPRERGPSDGGAGLGLALARWIANVHGGEVVLTRSSGSGTTFTVTLPARTA
jgi:signal transduction histidine kinase